MARRFNSLLDKFLALSERTGDGCWPWRGATDPRGYGHVRIRRESVPAHRFAYELYVGPIPEGLDLHHKCENPNCVRPDHLEPLARQPHIKGHFATQMTCRQGHDWSDPANVYYRPDGRRHCAACQRARMRRNYLKSKETVCAS